MTECALCAEHESQHDDKPPHRCLAIVDIYPGPNGPIEIHCECPGFEPEPSDEDEVTNV
ncbi:hypothetical protein MM1218R_01485 [Mycobacterium marinum]|uniref:hypothetical protein n=1 Tax=Mycobacterium marinum TaxID=1781 RepID=UPI000E29F35B|nr:hypothetical protein [Mycobacterium marinum]AXN43433.1 hypothetical protein MM1218R_01485 [Mycobacterium marinum]RFZ11515.1 hypothetical protein DE4381_01103 [Mycobacterium marinum]